MDRNRIKETLTALAIHTNEMVVATFTDGRYQPKDMLFLQNSIDGFEYTEEGVSVRQRSVSYVLKQSLSPSASISVIETVRKSQQFSEALNAIRSISIGGTPPPNGKLSSLGFLLDFIRLLVPSFPRDDSPNPKPFETVVEGYVNKLLGEATSYEARLELSGIVVEEPSVSFQLDNGARIRIGRTTQQDLVDIIPSHEVLSGQAKPYLLPSVEPPEYPTAIVHINSSAIDRDEIASHLHQALAVMRLFGTSPVELISHTIKDGTGAVYSIGGLRPISSQIVPLVAPFLIGTKSSSSIERFWIAISRLIPESISRPWKSIPDALSIAFQDYTDSLIRHGSIEQRIATAVMGLEALYLQGSSDGELLFRLKNLAAKALSHAGIDPFDVRDTIEVAYSIRSKHVHGDKVSPKTLARVRSRYGNSKKLLSTVLDFLRLSIVLMLHAGPLKKDQEDFIKRIEDSLISSERASELAEVLRPALESIGVASQ